MMKINDPDMKTKIDVELCDGLNVLTADSGAGKTYLMSLLASYCEAHKLRYCLINSPNVAVSKECDIILLDNATLYGTREYLTHCCDMAPYVLCISKTIPDVSNHKMYLSSLEYIDGTFVVRPYDVYN